MLPERPGIDCQLAGHCHSIQNMQMTLEHELQWSHQMPAFLFFLYFAHSTTSLFKLTQWQQQWCKTASWVADSAVPMPASCPVNRGVQIVRFWSMSVHRIWPKIHIHSSMQSLVCS